ncbi:MAG: TIGR04076 family protein [Clostridiales Family XIII bacterium]|jgi:uncharacterized repeat protein (TIGR04076 family)|nr:TIGR04076 family protein [Clostridiales Family XIII bacterium]
MRKCKITVVRRCFFEDLASEYVSIEDYGFCPVFKDGEVYITGGLFGADMPEGFCAVAWECVQKQAAVFAYGGKAMGIDDVHLMCCSDGARPVIFRLEAIEDDDILEVKLRP